MKELLYYGENIRYDSIGRKTVVILEDYNYGVSICEKRDKYDIAVGIYIAYFKAKIKQAHSQYSYSNRDTDYSKCFHEKIRKYKSKIEPFMK